MGGQRGKTKPDENHKIVSLVLLVINKKLTLITQYIIFFQYRGFYFTFFLNFNPFFPDVVMITFKINLHEDFFIFQFYNFFNLVINC